MGFEALINSLRDSVTKEDEENHLSPLPERRSFRVSKAVQERLKHKVQFARDDADDDDEDDVAPLPETLTNDRNSMGSLVNVTRPVSICAAYPSSTSSTNDPVLRRSSADLYSTPLLGEQQLQSWKMYEVDAELPVQSPTIMAMHGQDYAVTGPNAALLVHELSRTSKAPLQKRRKRAALHAGLLTLIIIGLSSWFLFEVVWSLVDDGSRGKNVLRWFELGGTMLVFFVSVGIIPWLRSRRLHPTISIIIFISVVLSTFIQVTFAIMNLILTLIWKSILSYRCTWGIDVFWTLRASGSICSTTRSATPWQVAAIVRLVITLIILALWLSTLRKFFKTLFIDRISTEQPEEPILSNEAQSLLSRQSASFKPVFNPMPNERRTSTNPDHLPHMPDRDAIYYQYASESTHPDWLAVRQDQVKADGKGQGIGTWLGAKLWGAVGWMIGVPSIESEENRRVEEENEKSMRRDDGDDGELGHARRNRLRDGQGSQSLPGQGRWSASNYHVNDIFERREQGLDEEVEEEEIRAPENMDDPSPKRTLTSSAAPSMIAYDLDHLDPEPHHRPSYHSSVSGHHHERTGSSGSTGGSLVFVRMNNGALVRKLSTIASEGSAGHRRRGEDNSSHGAMTSVSNVTSQIGQRMAHVDEVGRTG